MKNSRFKNELVIQDFIRVNFEGYRHVHDTLNGIIENRVKMNFKSAKSLISKTGFNVDKLIIFNKDKTKLYTTVNSINHINAIGSSDLIQSLYGVKIERKWYVFLGHQNLIAKRDGYKYNKYEPFTWEELSYMAHEQMFGRYISLDKNGSLIIKYDQLDKDTGVRELTGKIPGEYTTPYDAFISFNEYLESQTLDRREIAQMKAEIEEGKNKPRDPIKKVTWWDRLWGKEVPIFETDEWKEYIKSKNQGK